MRTTIVIVTALILLASGTVSAMTASEMAAAVPEELKRHPPAGTYWDEELGVFVFDPPIPIELPPSMILNGYEHELAFDNGLLYEAVYNYGGPYAALTKFPMVTPPCESGAWILTCVLLGCYNDPLGEGQSPDPVNVVVCSHTDDCDGQNLLGDGVGPELGRHSFQPAPYLWDLGQTRIAIWQPAVFQYPVLITDEEFWVVWKHEAAVESRPLSLYVLGEYRDGVGYMDEFRFFENYEDCPSLLLGWGPWMIRALGHCAELPPRDGKIDIKPTSCPNPFNPHDLGVISVAILGTPEPDPFDVREVDPRTVALMGVEPLRWDFEDVATPYGGELCGCHTDGPDGFEDLVFKFDCQDLRRAIEVTPIELIDDAEFEVILTWTLLDGITHMQGADCFTARLNVHYVPLEDLNGYDSYVAEKAAEGEGDGLQAAVWQSRPTAFSLYQNTPNPFRGETTISFSIPWSGHATLTVHDVSGRTVAILVDGELSAGTHAVEWDASVASGVYFCRLVVGGETAGTRMVVAR
jgi:hypothetical protein